VVPLVVALCVSAGNGSSAASLPDSLRSVDKIRPDSCLVSVLLVGAVAALIADEIRGWLVLPAAADLSGDVVFNVEELPVCIVDQESDSTASANVL